MSIRELAAFAHTRALEPDGEGAATWLSELVWREFYSQILWHRPDVVKHTFKAAYDGLRFPNDPARLAAWREGRTGYPIVDAAMRQLNTTGYMHNRLRTRSSTMRKRARRRWHCSTQCVSCSRRYACWPSDEPPRTTSVVSCGARWSQKGRPEATTRYRPMKKVQLRRLTLRGPCGRLFHRIG